VPIPIRCGITNNAEERGNGERHNIHINIGNGVCGLLVCAFDGEKTERLRVVIDLRIPRDRNGLLDSRNDARIDSPRRVKKYFCFRHFAVNFYYALVMVPVGRANYRTLFENLVLTARRIATLQEAVVVIERYFNERLHSPRVIRPAENLN